MTVSEQTSTYDFDGFLEGMKKAEILAVDTESNAKDIRDGTGYAMGLSVAYSLYPGSLLSEYFPFRHKHGTNLDDIHRDTLRQVLENHRNLVFHNAKFDIVSLRTLGITITGNFYDTMLMAHMVDENKPFSKSLDTLTKYYLNDEGKRKSNMFSGWIATQGWETLPVWLCRDYAAYDTNLTLRLFQFLWPKFVAQGLDKLWDVEQDFIRLLIKMEAKGVLIDKPLCTREYALGLLRMDEITDELGCNPGGSIGLEKLLINKLKLPVVKRTPKNKISFDKSAMQQYELMLESTKDKSAMQQNVENYDNETASLVLEYRGWQKACSSNYKAYLDLVSPDGRLRPNYKMHGTVTGRMSCEKPNLQQIPRNTIQPWNGAMKAAFVAKTNYTLWEADYAQLELRLGAAYAQETALIEVFSDPDRDIFTEMAQQVGMTRQDTKTLTYTLQYGGGVNRISQVFKVSKEEATEIKENYFNTYPGFKKITELASQKCRQQRQVKLWTNRIRHFDDPTGEAHKAFNSVIQGGAAEIVKRTMLKLDKEGYNIPNCAMLLQIHDSVVFEIANGLEHLLPKIQECMEAVEPDFGVKFKVSIKQWGE